MTRLLPLLLLALAACTGVAGNGHLTQESRSVAAFHGIAVGYGMKLHVTIGTPAAVKISGDDNIVPVVETSVDPRGILVIRLQDGTDFFDSQLGVTADVTVPAIDTLVAAGGSEVEATGLVADTFALEASGASRGNLGIAAKNLHVDASGGSELTVAGSADSLSLTASGGADFTGKDFATTNADLSLSGGSTAELKVTGDLSAELSGASHALVRGQPFVQERDLSGGSTLDIQ